MFKAKAAFSGFSVNNQEEAKKFYTEILGLKVDDEGMGLKLHLPSSGTVFVYPKDNHEPATFTILNFLVDNINEAVDELAKKGVKFERYDSKDMKTDEKGIARGDDKHPGPKGIAWFKDPASNFLALIQEK